jgi:hypothetical protein
LGVDLSGATVSALVVRPDGSTFTLTPTVDDATLGALHITTTATTQLSSPGHYMMQVTYTIGGAARKAPITDFYVSTALA